MIEVEPPLVADTEPVAAEVVDVMTGERTALCLVSGTPRQLALPNGTYLVRILPAGGERVERMVTVAESEPTVRSVRFAGDGRVPVGRGSADALWASAKRHALLHDVLAEARSGARGTVWAFPCDNERAHGALVPLHTHDEPLPRLLSESRIYVCTAGPETPTRFLSVPPRATVHAVATQSVRVELENVPARALLAYLAAGQSDTAQVISAWVASRVAEEVRSTRDAAAASLIGYHLVGRQKDLARWVAEVLPHVGETPDTRILQAWSMLCSASAASVPAARRLLLAATEPRVGPPWFRQGLELLRAALRVVEDHDRVGYRWDPRLSAALRRTDAYLEAADIESPFTSFTGSAPGSPAVACRTLADPVEPSAGSVQGVLQALGEVPFGRTAASGAVTASRDGVTARWYTGPEAQILELTWRERPLSALDGQAFRLLAADTVAYALLADGKARFALGEAGSGRLELAPEEHAGALPVLAVPRLPDFQLAEDGSPPRQTVVLERFTCVAERISNGPGSRMWRLTARCPEASFDGFWVTVMWPTSDPAAHDREPGYSPLVLPLVWNRVFREATSQLVVPGPDYPDWYSGEEPMPELPRAGRRTTLERSLGYAQHAATAAVLRAALGALEGGA